MDFPDRIGPLIQRLEAGHSLTQSEVDRAGQLQSLDLVKIGQDFVREFTERDRRQLAEMQQSEERKRNGG